MKKLVSRIVNKLKRDGLPGLVVSALRHAAQYPRRKARQKMIALESNKDKFSLIYKNNFWDSAESRSGEGSEANSTAALREWLPQIITRYDIKTFVDGPCGDFNWMKLVLPHVDVTYYGFDIVDEMIQANKAQYAQEGASFGVADLCEDELPACDLLMVRDCLFHLSFADIDRFLRCLRVSIINIY